MHNTGEFLFLNDTGLNYTNLKAAAYIVNGGTSSQFLKADGSLDGNSYSLLQHILMDY